jgi:AcrR family transcriptional regulator
MELVVERGYDDVTLRLVLDRAGATPAALDSGPTDLQSFCTRIFIANIEEFDRAVFGALPSGEWRLRLRTAAYAAAGYVQERPLETRFDMFQMLRAGDAVQAYRDRYMGRIVDLIDAGRQELDDPDSLDRSTAEGVFGSIYESMIRAQQRGNGTTSALETVPEMMYIAVRPYLGQEAAHEELSIAPPR